MDKFKCLLIFIGLRMFNIQSFIVGSISGIYIAQNYDIPDVKKLGNKLFDYIKNFEKKD
jgi:hypothetical protein|tara:strand:- start:135 stop:311 length:177 start_codon:yes stop_codon:yes gene_type:complete